MSPEPPILSLMARPVFLDVDNTLLDNDAAKAALEARIAAAVDVRAARRFWELYDIVRCDEDYVDLPTTIERLRQETPADAARVARIFDELPGNRFARIGPDRPAGQHCFHEATRCVERLLFGERCARRRLHRRALRLLDVCA